MQSTSFLYDDEPDDVIDAQDWYQAYNGVVDDDQRTPCSNPDCDQLCVSLYCSERCRRRIEESDDVIDVTPRQLPAVQSLGEAPVSMNVHLPIHGRDVLVTLRGIDPDEVLGKLEALLQRFPVPTPPTATAQTPQGAGFCQIHNVTMRDNEKDGRHWFSHKVGDGWCRGKGVKHG